MLVFVLFNFHLFEIQIIHMTILINTPGFYIKQPAASRILNSLK